MVVAFILQSPVASHFYFQLSIFISLSKQSQMTAILLFPLIPPLIVLFWFGLFFDTGCVQTVAIIGPIFGFLLGSLCAKLYVDIGFVNLGKWIMYSYVFIYTPLFVRAHAMMHLRRSEDNL